MQRAQLIAVALMLGATPAVAQHHMHMQGALGPYPMSREASGTSWQPELAPMPGYHSMSGDWMLMLHGYADLVYDRQGGPRGDSKVFVPSMLMAMAQRPLGPGTWAVRTMLSLDPLMGKSGYPLLLQTGETADGVEPLVDRQHPHDLFMELATTYSVAIGEGSVFGYVGLPGEPALGPPAFMHRASGMQIPEAPLTHHWLDSTHITFGVVTLGSTWRDLKLEASAFNGREPDQFRWNIETRGFDSWSARLSYNPTPAWSGQVSFGYLASPEQLEPEISVRRTTASISHTAAIDGGSWSTTLAVGVNREGEHNHPGYSLESTRQFRSPLTLFGRAEYLHNEHLVEEADAAVRVGKLSVGGAYKLASTAHVALSAGALASFYLIPDALEDEYRKQSDVVPGVPAGQHRVAVLPERFCKGRVLLPCRTWKSHTRNSSPNRPGTSFSSSSAPPATSSRGMPPPKRPSASRGKR